jgi:hypothetical protein
MTLYERVLALAEAERRARLAETRQERARRHEEWLAKMLLLRLKEPA